MVAVGKTSSSLRIEEYDFISLILSEIFHLTAKYKSENVLLNKLFFQILNCKKIAKYCFLV